ncbi:MAG: YfiR family protein [Bacteroidota bacterium]|nr:YfiR family protein [Bacteroidota bacterium]
MKYFFYILITILLSCGIAFTQEMPVPVEIQIPLFKKILTFDRNLKTRAGNEIDIGVLFQKGFKLSSDVKNEFVTTASPTQDSIDGLPVNIVALEYSDEPNLKSNLSKHNIDILYITPMRAVDLKMVSQLCQTHKILTITGVPQYIENGISVGLDIKAEKPQIIINLQSTKAEGADFSSKLLNLAKVIK